MKPLSLRLQLALLAGFMAGGLLLAAGAWFWEAAHQQDLDRVDRELRNLGSPQLERVNGGDHWVRFEGALGFVMGQDRRSGLVVWVKHGERVLHQSAHWPAAVDPAEFPPLTRYEPPFAPATGQPPPPPPRRNEPISPQNPPLPRMEPQFFTRRAEGRTWRFGVMGNPYLTLVLGADLAEFTAGLTRLRQAYLTALPVVLLLVGAGSWLLAGRALRPVNVLTQTVERVTARGLDQRIPPLTHDPELSRLITMFNAMMDRLESGFHQATRFSADAAHELRTPLTILQGELELALHAAPPGSEEQRTYSRLSEEIARLRAITDKLLLLAQADAGKLPVQRESLNLSQLTEEALEDVRLLAPQLTVTARVTPDLLVHGDPHLLPQLIQNLTGNAAKYNRDGGSITVQLAAEADTVVLEVTNTGPGIPADQQARIFDRFHRAETSRSRELGGVGLGLSLAREIARAHEGQLTLEAGGPEATTFRLTLPRGTPTKPRPLA